MLVSIQSLGLHSNFATAVKAYCVSFVTAYELIKHPQKAAFETAATTCKHAKNKQAMPQISQAVVYQSLGLHERTSISLFHP